MSADPNKLKEAGSTGRIVLLALFIPVLCGIAVYLGCTERTCKALLAVGDEVVIGLWLIVLGTVWLWSQRAPEEKLILANMNSTIQRMEADGLPHVHINERKVERDRLALKVRNKEDHARAAQWLIALLAIAAGLLRIAGYFA